MPSPISLHRRLTIILCGLVTVVGLVGSLGTYLVAKKLAADFDTSLRNVAADFDTSLRNVAVGDDVKQEGAEHKPANLVLQVWEAGDERHPIRSSDPSIALPKTAQGMSQVKVDGELWDVFSMHAQYSSVQIAERQSLRQHNAETMAIGAMLLALSLIPLLALAIGIVVRLSLRPLDRMGRLAAQIDINHLAPLGATGAPSELHPFLDSINRMIEKISTLLDNEKKFVANAAHELRTPITALQLQLEALRQSDDSEREERFNDLQRGIVRTGSLVSQLLGLARAEMGRNSHELIAISLPVLVADVVADLLPLALDRGVDLGALELEPLTVYAVDADIRILLKNLIDNAIRYGSHDGHCGRIDVSVWRDGGHAVLEVTDNGPGIPEAQLTQVFERFFRGKVSNEAGSGLGLSIVATLVAHYKGRVSLRNRSDGNSGVVATLELPLSLIVPAVSLAPKPGA